MHGNRVLTPVLVGTCLSLLGWVAPGEGLGALRGPWGLSGGSGGSQEVLGECLTLLCISLQGCFVEVGSSGSAAHPRQAPQGPRAP